MEAVPDPVDTLVQTKLKGASDASLSRMRVEQLKDMHRRLNENLDEPIPLPTMRFPYARNEKEAKHVSNRFKLYEGKIEPRDLCQGAIGDCWLVAALASASEHPSVIRKAFLTRERNSHGTRNVGSVIRLQGAPA